MNNNRWTKETALAMIKKNTKGLSYWSAFDYLVNYCKYSRLELLNK